nr:hypothetical protein [uncultured Pedobacter sp.]
MEIKDTLNIKAEFGDTPGARYRKDGDHSGQEFLEDHLRPKFIKAKESGYILSVVLDGLWGSPSSFISGSFGLLSIEFGKDAVLKHLQLVSSNKITYQKYISEINNPTAE